MSSGDEGMLFCIGFVIALIICTLIPNTSVTEAEWEFASTSCQSNGGVEYTRGAGMIRSQKIICKNKARFTRKPTDD